MRPEVVTLPKAAFITKVIAIQFRSREHFVSDYVPDFRRFAMDKFRTKLDRNRNGIRMKRTDPSTNAVAPFKNHDLHSVLAECLGCGETGSSSSDYDDIRRFAIHG